VLKLALDVTDLQTYCQIFVKAAIFKDAKPYAKTRRVLPCQKRVSLVKGCGGSQFLDEQVGAPTVPSAFIARSGKFAFNLGTFIVSCPESNLLDEKIYV
jgi:hypothetical protein